MRILHILDHSIPVHSGYTFRTRAILDNQRAMGFETFHVTSAKHPAYTGVIEDVDGYRFYRTKEADSIFRSVPVFNQMAIINSLAKRVGEIVEEVRPDVLHAHSPALNGLAALRVAQWFRLPVVYECRAFWEDAAVDHGTSSEGGLRYRATKALETYVFRKVQGVTTICEGLRRDILSRGVAEERVTVIPNAVDIQKFRIGGQGSPTLREKLGLTGALTLGFIGSFYAYEGLRLLLEALPLVLERCPDAQILLVGGGPQEAVLRDCARQLGVENNVIFVGRVPHDAVNLYYDLIDILVYPRYSIRLTELVTPLKPLEAMAQGRLLIASDVGGHKELITDKENGWLFRAGDVGDLAATVLALNEAKSTWDSLKVRARLHVESERTWAISVSRYQCVYDSAINLFKSR